MQVPHSANLNRAVTKATSFLEGQLSAVSSDPYALNIITYALTLAGSSQATNALNMLTSLAVTEGV